MKIPEEGIEIMMFAPCGMNCKVCYRHCNHKRPCGGCLNSDTGKPAHCRNCKIKDCLKTKGVSYCFECVDFPCKQIKNLEKSYNTRYQASLIENSRFVQEHGLVKFMDWQTEKYTCPKCGGIISIHDSRCSECQEMMNELEVSVNYIIREIKKSEYPLLNDFLYETIFQKDGNNLVSKDMIKHPALQQYIREFGTQKDDFCLCAEVKGTVIGAVWTRCIEGFGTVDKSAPELAISIYQDYRGQGIGTDLMKHMLKLLKNKGYQKTSLSVQKENYAVRMYLNLGYEVVDEKEEEYILQYLFA